jgi:hypothetical protein
MLSATPVSERIPCHIIVSTKFFCIALRQIVAESGNGNGAFDLQNVAAEALAQVSTEAPLTMIEKVRNGILVSAIPTKVRIYSGTKSAEYVC